MGLKTNIKKKIRYIPFLHYLYLDIRNLKLRARYHKKGQRYYIEQTWAVLQKTPLDLDNPKTLNEKIQWLKMNDYKKIYSVWADKYACREYIKEHFGEEYLVPLLFVTRSSLRVNPRNINTFPCVIKANHSSGDWMFLKSANDINWKELRAKCREWLKNDYHIACQEKQYKYIKRKIIVEKMLLTKEGKIPNDYKIHYINGKPAFIYCSIDREGNNYRQNFDMDWNPLPFTCDGKSIPITDKVLVEKPKTLSKMLEIGDYIAKERAYVRVDFYDVDGKLYCGEITLHHGGGYDAFNPPDYDLKYGQMLKLPIDK